MFVVTVAGRVIHDILQYHHDMEYGIGGGGHLSTVCAAHLEGKETSVPIEGTPRGSKEGE